MNYGMLVMCNIEINNKMHNISHNQSFNHKLNTSWQNILLEYGIYIHHKIHWKLKTSLFLKAKKMIGEATCKPQTQIYVCYTAE